MDENTATNELNNRNKKIKDFFYRFKKQLLTILIVLILSLFTFFILKDLEKKNKIKIANEYSKVTIEYFSGNTKNIKERLIKIVKQKDTTYSPLSLYFLLDQNILTDQKKINGLFDILINETNLEKEIKNLIIYKKGLFNAELESENNLIKILNPLINSDSIWKSHALYLMAEYFYSKNEKQKSKEFFEKIINLEKSNDSIKTESQKRLNRDFSE